MTDSLVEQVTIIPFLTATWSIAILAEFRAYFGVGEFAVLAHQSMFAVIESGEELAVLIRLAAHGIVRIFVFVWFSRIRFAVIFKNFIIGVLNSNIR